jgi:hypothetical protein
VNDPPGGPLQFGLKDLLALMAVIAVALGAIPTAYKSPTAALVMYLLVGAAQVVLSVPLYRWRPRVNHAGNAEVGPHQQPYELALLGSGASLSTWLLLVGWLAYRWIFDYPFNTPLSAVLEVLAMVGVVAQVVTFFVNLIGLLVMREWTRDWQLSSLLLLNMASTALLPAVMVYVMS